MVIMWQTTEPSDSWVDLGPTQPYTRHPMTRPGPGP
jgi:hypothetical protein